MGLWLKIDGLKEVPDIDRLNKYYSDETRCFPRPLKQVITIGSSTFSGHLNSDDQLVLIDDEHYDYGAMVVRNEEYNNYKTKYEDLEKKYMENECNKCKGDKTNRRIESRRKEYSNYDRDK